MGSSNTGAQVSPNFYKRKAPRSGYDEVSGVPDRGAGGKALATKEFCA
jgi:hypothetical protein